MCDLIPRLMFFALFVCYFLFVARLPSSPAEVRGQGQFRSSSRPESRHVAQILSLRSADVLANKLAVAATGELGGRIFCLFFVQGKFFFCCSSFFFFLPRLTDWYQTGSPTGTRTLPRSSGDGHVFLSRPLICNCNLFCCFFFDIPFRRPPTPQCCATCVTAEFCTTKLNQKERNGYMSLYIYIKNI